MKYFTKEWYELSQKTGYHLLLEEDARAECFSEDYYRVLYKNKLEEKLSLWKEVREIQKLSFREEEVQKELDQRISGDVQYYENVLPEEILDKIADLRVFSLRRASREVINRVTEFCKENHLEVEKAVEAYQKSLKSIENNPFKQVSFHDCVLKSLKEEGNCLTIQMDNSGGFTAKKLVRFHNYKIINHEESILSLHWIYDEIYKTDLGYELHVLLWQEKGLVQFTIEFEKVSFE